jgi:GDSL-like Lipase/Acylhydrolase family
MGMRWRFSIALPLAVIGLALVVPGTAAAAPAQPQSDPFSTTTTLAPCNPVTSTPHEPVTLRPATARTDGIPGYLLPSGMSYFGIGTAAGSPYLKNNLLVGPSSFTCTSDGYDQTNNSGWAELDSPTDPAAQVFTWYYAQILDGETYTNDLPMCAALIDAGLTAQFGDFNETHAHACDQYTWRPSSAASIPVAGTPLSIGYAIYPPSKAGFLTTPAPYPTLEVDIYQYTDPLTGTPPSHQALATSIACAMPFTQSGSCTETLSAWVQTELTGFYGTTLSQAIRASDAVRAKIHPAPVPDGKVGLTVSADPDTIKDGRPTPSTRFHAVTTGTCGDGTAPAVAVHSDVTGRDVTPPVLTYLPDDRSQFYVGQVGTASVQASCAGTVVASAPIDVQADAYVALGDSYAAGEGDSPDSVFLAGTSATSSQTGASTGCHRSPNSWAYDVATQSFLAHQPFDFVACSGATITDIYDTNGGYYGPIGEFEPPQIFSVDSKVTKLATLSIGGNDAGFSDILSSCILGDSITGSSCTDKSGKTYRDATEKIADLEQGGFGVGIGSVDELRTLSEVYTDVASRLARNGILVVTGYPEIFSTDSKSYRLTGEGGAGACDLGNGLSILKSSATWVNSLAVQGNEAIARQVAVANAKLQATRPDVRVVMADYDSSFAGHRVCDKDSWLNGLRIRYSIKDWKGQPFYQTSFHPNRQGQVAIAEWANDAIETAQWSQAHPAPEVLATGSASTFSAAGFNPGEEVTASLHSTPVALGTYRADARGTVDVPVRIPAGFATGAHSIVLTGKTSRRSQSFAVTVARPAPAWWRHPYVIAAIAALVVLLAAGAVIRRRSRFA